MDPQRGVRYPDIHMDQRVFWYLLHDEKRHLCDCRQYHQLLRAAHYYVDVQHRHHLQTQTYHKQGESAFTYVATLYKETTLCIA